MTQLKTWLKFDSSVVYEEAIQRGSEAFGDEDAEKACQDTFIRALDAPVKREVLNRGLAISQHLFDEAPDGAEAAIIRKALTSALTQLHPTFGVAHRASLTANRLGCLIGTSVELDQARDKLMGDIFLLNLFETDNDPTRDGMKALWPRMYMDERMAMRWALHGDSELFDKMLQVPWGDIDKLTDSLRESSTTLYSLSQDEQGSTRASPLTSDERAQVVSMEAIAEAKGEISFRNTLIEFLGDNYTEEKLAQLWVPYCRMLLKNMEGIDLNAILAYQQSPDGRRFAELLEKTAEETSADGDALVARAKRERTEPSVFEALLGIF